MAQATEYSPQCSSRAIAAKEIDGSTDIYPEVPTNGNFIQNNLNISNI
jgi:hypothetical protein